MKPGLSYRKPCLKKKKKRKERKGEERREEEERKREKERGKGICSHSVYWQSLLL